MDRVYPTNVKTIFKALEATARKYGIDTSNWFLMEGSPSVGRPWRLMHKDPTTGGLSDIMMNGGYLGSTTREAYNSLDTMIRTLQAFHGKCSKCGGPHKRDNDHNPDKL